MEVLTKEEFDIYKREIFDKVRSGKIFIHPTDTIYGIGCDATDNKAVNKIRMIKGRVSSPFSVIAPSKQWIYDNFDVKKHARDWVEKLPGPYTLILKNNKKVVAEQVAPGLSTLGVRIPNNWFGLAVSELGFPIVTTSANKVGDDFMTSLDDLDSKIKENIDFIIYEGIKKCKPSKLVDLTKGVEIKVR